MLFSYMLSIENVIFIIAIDVIQLYVLSHQINVNKTDGKSNWLQLLSYIFGGSLRIVDFFYHSSCIGYTEGCYNH